MSRWTLANFRTADALAFSLAIAATLPGCGSTAPGTPAPDAAPGSDAGDTAPAPCTPPGALACDTLAAWPARLGETGFLANGGVTPPARAHSYTPVPELYSNGLRKTRFLLLPEGATIDNSKRDAWQFPSGTLFVKTFYDGAGAGTGKPIETRFIRRSSNRFEPYEYTVYRWNDAGTDADRLDIAGNQRTPVPVTVAGRTFMHTIPSQNDCAECHEKNALVASGFIGFDEVRLGNVLLPEAEPQLTLLARKGIFKTTPPTPYATIVDADPTLMRVKRFVFGQCAHCHNGGMDLVDLRPGVLVTNTVGKEPLSPGTTAPPGSYRVTAGDPEKSVLYVQARGTNIPAGLRPMPQIGVDVRDLPEFAAGLADLRAWISSLRP